MHLDSEGWSNVIGIKIFDKVDGKESLISLEVSRWERKGGHFFFLK